MRSRRHDRACRTRHPRIVGTTADQQRRRHRPESAASPAARASAAPAGPPHLFGDWGGLRTDLGNYGINLDLDYTTESAGNVAGGLRQGVDYAHQIGLQLDVDWEKLADIPGFSTHMVVVNRAGRNLSSDYIGDNVLQAQEIFGAGFDMAVHDVWFYGEEKLFDGRVDAVFGRVFPGMDFAASPLYCDFMTLTICGHPRALTAEQGFIDWPQNTWGGRVRVRPTAETYVMSGIYASQPFPGGGRSGFDWSTNQITGAFYATELGWEPVFGRDRLSGHYKVGVGYDTSNFPNQFSDMNGNAFVLSGLPPATSHGRTQVWATFDQIAVPHRAGAEPWPDRVGRICARQPRQLILPALRLGGHAVFRVLEGATRRSDRARVHLLPGQPQPDVDRTPGTGSSVCRRLINLAFRPTRWCWRPTIVSQSTPASSFSPNSSGSYVPAACRRCPMRWCSA